MQTTLKILFLTIILGTVSVVSAQKTIRDFEASRITTAPRIDGKLTEAEWQNCKTESGFFQFAPNPGKACSQRTEVKIMYGSKAVYVGAKMFDSSPDSISDVLTARDDRGMSDGFTILIDTYGDAVVAYTFGVTAAGVQIDAKSLGSGGEDMNWNAVWKSATQINSDGWTAEMEIPYSALRFPKQEIQNWRVNFIREINRSRELGLWQEADPSADNLLIYMGNLNGVKDIEAPLRLSITPFGAAYAEINSETGNTSYSLKGGLDLKYGISESFTLDMMLIPDFGQVQSDDKYLNLTPYETYYQENRTFFTEGTEIFDRAEVFYSRRIGGTPNGYYDVEDNLESNQIVKSNLADLQLLNATKVSGKTKGGYSLGLLNGITQASRAVVKDTLSGEEKEIITQPFTNYNVLAGEKSFGKNSYFSLINTNLFIPGTSFSANVTGTETKLSNKKNTYAVIGKGALSSVFQNSAKAELGHYYTLRFAKTSGNFQFWVNSHAKSNTYDPNYMGYIQKNNEFIHSGTVSYNEYETKGRILSWNTDLTVNHEMLYFPRVFSVANMNSFLRMTFLNHLTTGARFSTDLSNKYDYREPREEGRFVQLPRTLYNASAFISSNYAKKIALDVFAQTWKTKQEGSQSYVLNVSPRWQPTNKILTIFRVNTNFTNAEIGYASHSENSDSILFGLRDRVSVTNTLNLQYIFTNKSALSIRGRHYRQTVEYKSAFDLNNGGSLTSLPQSALPDNINSNAFSADVIFSWEFAPGSQLSVAWKNLIYADDDYIETPYVENFSETFSQTQTNSISLKVLYYLDYLYLKKG